VLQIHTTEAFPRLGLILCSRPSRAANGVVIAAGGPVYGRLRSIIFRTSCRTGSNWLQPSFQLEGVAFLLELSCKLSMCSLCTDDSIERRCVILFAPQRMTVDTTRKCMETYWE